MKGSMSNGIKTFLLFAKESRLHLTKPEIGKFQTRGHFKAGHGHSEPQFKSSESKCNYTVITYIQNLHYTLIRISINTIREHFGTVHLVKLWIVSK